jgi:hypothetical protein
MTAGQSYAGTPKPQPPIRRGEGMMMQHAAVYRAKASYMRERARSAHDPVAYQELLRLAEQYNAVARQTELLWAAHKHVTCPELLH